MTTSLAEARRAFSQFYSMLGTTATTVGILRPVADFLDSQVPLNVENEDLKQRLSRAEAFINETYRQASALVQTPQTIGNVQSVIDVIQCQPNASLNCTAHISFRQCHCPACRVRANA